MRTVKYLIEQLKKFPEDAVCWAYEGETRGIVIRNKKYNDFLENMEMSLDTISKIDPDKYIHLEGEGFIPCSEYDDEDKKVIIPSWVKRNNKLSPSWIKKK